VTADVLVGRLDELPPGALRLVEVGSARIVLARVGDEVCAVGEVCPHRGGPLSEGKLAGARLTCPWHGWMFDVRTGQCLLPDRSARVPAYPVRVEAGEIRLEAAET
jgi:nitrite reductase/ring-hydroxylating ferredoxin subunit